MEPVTTIVGLGLTLSAGAPAVAPMSPITRREVVVAGKPVAGNAAQGEHHGEHGQQHQGRHDHAPGTRLVAAATTSATSLGPIVVLAYPDHLEYAKDAESNRIIAEIKDVAGYWQVFRLL